MQTFSIMFPPVFYALGREYLNTYLVLFILCLFSGLSNAYVVEVAYRFWKDAAVEEAVDGAKARVGQAAAKVKKIIKAWL